MTTLTCPECSGEMIAGYLLDKDYAGPSQTMWVEGTQEKGTFGVRLSNRATADVTAYRCTGCGTLTLKAF